MSAPLLLPDSPAALPVNVGGMETTTPSTYPKAPTVLPSPILSSQYVPAPTPSTSKTSGTVLSNANVIENTIPSLNQRANAYTPNVPTMLVNDAGSSTGASPATADETQDPIFKQEMDLINGLRSNNDDASNASVDSIMRNYSNLASDLNTRQEGADAMVSNALLRGGTTRYAPGNAAGILSAQHYSDIEQIGKLQDEENAKIAAVRQAQATQNFSLVEKTLGELDKIRADKQDATKALAEKMQTARDQQVQSSRDSAIAHLVSQGVTDPKELLQHLNFDESGRPIGNFTADQISKTLAAIQKNTGIKDLSSLSAGTRDFFVLKENGQLPANIASLPEGSQLSAFLREQYGDTHKVPGNGPGVTPTTQFTKTQLNKGASNAGVPYAEFSTLDQDTKNYFINGYSHFTAAIKAVKAGTNTPAQLAAAIDAATISDKGKDMLRTAAKNSGVALPGATKSDQGNSSGGSLTDFFGQDYKSAVNEGASNAVDYVRNLFGI